MHPVYIDKKMIGKARNWKSAALLAKTTRGGEWKATKQAVLFGRVRRWVYRMKQKSK